MVRFIQEFNWNQKSIKLEHTFIKNAFVRATHAKEITAIHINPYVIKHSNCVGFNYSWQPLRTFVRNVENDRVQSEFRKVAPAQNHCTPEKVNLILICCNTFCLHGNLATGEPFGWNCSIEVINEHLSDTWNECNLVGSARANRLQHDLCRMMFILATFHNFA